MVGERGVVTARRPGKGAYPTRASQYGDDNVLRLEATASEEGFEEADEVLTRIEFGVLG